MARSTQPWARSRTDQMGLVTPKRAVSAQTAAPEWEALRPAWVQSLSSHTGMRMTMDFPDAVTWIRMISTKTARF